MSLNMLPKISKKEYVEERGKNVFYHYFYVIMSKRDIFKLYNILKKNNYAIMITDNRFFIKQEKDFSIEKNNINEVNFFKVDNMYQFEISLIDNADMDVFFYCLKEIGFDMIFLFESGGFDATPFYLIGNKTSADINLFIEYIKLENAYNFIKSLDKSSSEYHLKKVLEEIEGYLIEMNICGEHVKEWILRRNDFLFGQRPLEAVLTNSEKGLLNWLKGRLGREDAEPF